MNHPRPGRAFTVAVIVALLCVTVAVATLLFFGDVPDADRTSSGDELYPAERDGDGESERERGQRSRSDTLTAVQRNGLSDSALSRNQFSDLQQLFRTREAQIEGMYSCLSDVVSLPISVEDFHRLRQQETNAPEGRRVRDRIARSLMRLDGITAREVLGLAFAHVRAYTDLSLIEILATWLAGSPSSRGVARGELLATAATGVRGLTKEQHAIEEELGASGGDIMWSVGTIDVHATVMLLDAFGVSWLEAAELLYAPERALVAPFQTILWLEKEADERVLPFLQTLLTVLDASSINPRRAPHPGVRPALQEAIGRLGGALPGVNDAVRRAVEAESFESMIEEAHAAATLFKQHIVDARLSYEEILDAIGSMLSKLPDDAALRSELLNGFAAGGTNHYWKQAERVHSSDKLDTMEREQVALLLSRMSMANDPWQVYYLGLALSATVRKLSLLPGAASYYDAIYEAVAPRFDHPPPGVEPYGSRWLEYLLNALLHVHRTRALAEYPTLLTTHWDTPVRAGIAGAVESFTYIERLASHTWGFTASEIEQLQNLVMVVFNGYLAMKGPIADWQPLIDAANTAQSVRLTDSVPTLRQLRNHAGALDAAAAVRTLDNVIEALGGGD